MQSLAYKVATFRWNVVVLLSKNHDQFALDVARACQRIVLLSSTKRVGVDIGCKETHGSTDALVEGTSISKMTAKTHASRTNTAITVGQ